jgi:hypothetical protein
MTKEDQKQIEELTAFVYKLDPYAKHLGTSLHGYLNIRPEDTRKLFEAYYGPDWKDKVKPSALTCGTCKLNVVKSIAIEYEGARHTIEQIMSRDKKKKDVNVE